MFTTAHTLKTQKHILIQIYEYPLFPFEFKEFCTISKYSILNFFIIVS